MNKKTIAITGIALLVPLMLILFSMTYTVSFHEIAIKTRFGQTSGEPITDAGLKFKLPVFADRVQTFDKRLQLLESPAREMGTADGQSVVVEAFLLWRVDPDNVVQFANAYRTIADARAQLNDEFLNAISVLSRYDFNDLIGDENRLEQAEGEIKDQLASLAGQGIIAETVGISQLAMPAKATSSVLQRMKATRDSLAGLEHIRGSSEAEVIFSEANSKADKIRAFANQRATELSNKGTEKAAEYLAQMSEDEELAIFLVWLDALQRGMSDTGTFVLPTSMAPFHLMDPNALLSARGIPLPGNRTLATTSIATDKSNADGDENGGEADAEVANASDGNADEDTE